MRYVKRNVHTVFPCNFRLSATSGRVAQPFLSCGFLLGCPSPFVSQKGWVCSFFLLPPFLPEWKILTHPQNPPLNLRRPANHWLQVLRDLGLFDFPGCSNYRFMQAPLSRIPDRSRIVFRE